MRVTSSLLLTCVFTAIALGDESDSLSESSHLDVLVPWIHSGQLEKVLGKEIYLEGKLEARPDGGGLWLGLENHEPRAVQLMLKNRIAEEMLVPHANTTRRFSGIFLSSDPPLFKVTSTSVKEAWGQEKSGVRLGLEIGNQLGELPQVKVRFDSVYGGRQRFRIVGASQTIKNANVREHGEWAISPEVPMGKASAVAMVALPPESSPVMNVTDRVRWGQADFGTSLMGMPTFPTGRHALQLKLKLELWDGLQEPEIVEIESNPAMYLAGDGFDLPRADRMRILQISSNQRRVTLNAGTSRGIREHAFFKHDTPSGSWCFQITSVAMQTSEAIVLSAPRSAVHQPGLRLKMPVDVALEMNQTFQRLPSGKRCL